MLNLRPLIEPATGMSMGFVLSRIGFTSADEVRKMFLFADLRLTLTFAVAVVLLFVSWRWVVRVRASAPSFVGKGPIVGGALFGVGWALCGACPSVALIQLGEGQLGALVTLAGIVVGNWACATAQARWLRWPTPTCASG